MFELMTVLLLLVILGIMAPRWGYDSRDGLGSKEWKRRNLRGWSL